MKKQVTPTKSVGISRGAVGKHYGVNGGSVSAWVKAGCPQLTIGQFVLAVVEAWLLKRDDKNAQGRDLKEEKTRQEIERIKRDIQARDIDLEKQRGTVHDKSACAASLTAMRARESAVLHGLSQRFAGAFPEATAQAVWLEREVDGVIERLQG
jgi:hypothetical protein